MEKVITWTKGVFNSSYQIFSNGQICGNLIFETWNNHALGIMSKRNYYFRRKSFTDTTTTIYGNNHEELGTINFHIWQFRAIVTLKNQIPYSWNYSNGWLSEWIVSNHQNTHLTYKASSGSGTVMGQGLDEELIVLAGFYIREYFSRLLMIFIGFVAIMVALRGV